MYAKVVDRQIDRQIDGCVSSSDGIADFNKHEVPAQSSTRIIATHRQSHWMVHTQ